MKDFSYYEFEVGEGRENYKPVENKLVWNVLDCDFNNNKIVIRNLFEFSSRFSDGLIEANKKYKDDFEFLKRVREILAYSYWSKSEYEIIVTSWPPFISKDELNRINNEDGKYRASVNLETEKKIDVYTQVMMNWEAFREYLLRHRDLIPKKSNK